MPVRKTYFIKDAYYHVYNRGNRKQEIFYSDRDYQRFIHTTVDCLQRCNVTLLCYCLMPNHFHFLIQQKNHSTSDFMRRLQQSHSMYLNTKYDLVGSAFQGRFGARHVNTDRYLLHLSKYIHRNPLSIVQNLAMYEYSSYPHYIGKRSRDIVVSHTILDYFLQTNPRKDYERYVLEEPYTEENEINTVFTESGTRKGFKIEGL